MAGRRAKGSELEQAFGGWMKQKLRYTRTEFRVPVKGKIADRAYEVDIKAEKYDPLWDNMRLLGAALIVLAMLSALLPQLRSLRHSIEHAVGTMVPSLAPYGLVILGAIATVLGFQGKRRSVTRAWVECKDTKTRVKREQVQKLASSVEDVCADSAGKWKPDRVVLVAGSGFDPDALNFAREHGFVTYQRDGDEFKLVA
jgi:hypothetical protein